MEPLSSDQLKKIEENRAQALLRRQQKQAGGGVQQSSTFNNDRLVGGQLPRKMGAVFPPKTSGKNPQAPNQVTSIVKTNAPVNVDAVCCLISGERFCVKMPYHEKSIEIMKTIHGRVFDQTTKCWTFPLAVHDVLVKRLQSLKPEVSVSQLPRNVVNCLKSPAIDIAGVDFDKIDKTLQQTLLPFQKEGIRFGISRNGRCLIADEMGLGKTLQALGIAHFYLEHWPLLIVCPSSMRFPWEQAILEYLPSVNPFTIAVMTSGNDDILSQNVIIVSYDLLKSCLPQLKRKKIGVLIFDESHYIKNCKSARTEAAQQISKGVSHVILLSGTPALSRPQEIFPQLRVIDPVGFNNFHEFGIRYCDGRPGKFGWDYSGCTNSEELQLLLKGKFMIRRMKKDVFEEMPSKIRKVVYLHPKMITTISNQMQAFATRIQKLKGADRRSTMLDWYSATAPTKVEAVASYITDKLECTKKMLVFGHHTVMLDGISELLAKNRVDFIRIDGSTGSEHRSQLCEQFQTCPDIRVAVLSLKAANAGITLTAASLVLFAELYWNPGELTQAEDRAHRIGQNESVLVEYLVAKGTVDDYMINLVGNKLNVLNRCGLSKDCFRDIDSTSLADQEQKTLPEMVQKATEPSDDNAFSSSQVGDLFSVEFDSLEDAFKDDDVFDGIDLESIEDQYCTEPKRPKLNPT